MTVYNDQVSEYITGLFVPQDEILDRIRAEAPGLGLPPISIKPEEGRFLQLLVRASGGMKVLEIGTLGGHSAIWLARGLAPSGKLITLELEASRAQIARANFEAAGVSSLVEVRVGNAHQLLEDLIQEGPFDFVFIDAEKSGNQNYYGWALDNVRLGGIVAVHNAFRKGSVAYQVPDDDYSETMRQFNRRAAKEERAITTIYPAGDGTLLSVRIT